MSDERLGGVLAGATHHIVGMIYRKKNVKLDGLCCLDGLDDIDVELGASLES